MTRDEWHDRFDTLKAERAAALERQKAAEESNGIARNAAYAAVDALQEHMRLLHEGVVER